MWHRKNEQIIKTETMEKKTINDLVDAIQQIRPEPREKVENFVREFFNVIRRALIRERFVKVKGLGTFKLVDVSPRESVDVNTGERIEIEGHLKVTFTPDNAMRDAVNRPFAHLQAFVINEGTDIEEMSRTDGFKLDEETEFSESLPNQDVVKQEYDSAKAATSNADSKDDEVVDFVVEENVNDIPKKKETPAVTQTQEVTEFGDVRMGGTDWAVAKTNKRGTIEANAGLSTSMTQGTEVHVLGFPAGLGAGDGQSRIEPIYNKMNVARNGLNNQGCIMVSQGVAHGNSGGPVFCVKDGKIYAVAIVSKLESATQQYNDSGTAITQQQQQYDQLVPIKNIR